MAENEEQQKRQEALPKITFVSFIMGLTTQALANLGEIPHPSEGRVQIDLPAAKEFIDILGVLRDKTIGNLDESEQALLENALYDLRMKYVERVRDSR